MTFSLIFENRDVVTQKDIYGGNFGTVGRWIGVVPGTMLGYAIGNQFDHGGYGAALGSGIGAAIGGQIGKYQSQMHQSVTINLCTELAIWAWYQPARMDLWLTWFHIIH